MGLVTGAGQRKRTWNHPPIRPRSPIGETCVPLEDPRSTRALSPGSVPPDNPSRVNGEES